MKIDAGHLAKACGDDSQEAGVLITSELVPVGGHGAPVKPAVYAGGLFQEDRRWRTNGAGPEPVKVVVIDNVPSQANRLEAALLRLRSELGLPDVELDLSGCGPLPPHLPRRLSGFRFPHRQADAYLRDATLDGEDFPKTQLGRELMEATADQPSALLQWFPQALLYGFWQSHLGKRRSHAKLARSWVSEIAGYRPATTETRVLGLKGDPLNLSVDEQVAYESDEDWVAAGWQLTEEKKVSGGKQKDRLSNLGHGQVPFPKQGEQGAPGSVSFAEIEQRATLSLASLRRIWVGAADANAAARALLASLGVVAHAAAFGGSFSLRSGCDLRTPSSSWTWLGATDDEPLDPPDLAAAISLFRECVDRAEAAGLPVGSRWAGESLHLKPSEALEKVIRRTWSVAI
jgi:CRISPR-associated protein Csb1